MSHDHATVKTKSGVARIHSESLHSKFEHSGFVLEIGRQKPEDISYHQISRQTFVVPFCTYLQL